MMRHLEWIPETYFEESAFPGRIHKLEYETEDFFQKGKVVKKHAWVYLPYGYKKGEWYPSVYFMHGAGTELDSFLWPAGQEFLFFHVLNHMMEAGEIPPLIIVFPTYYQGGYGPHNCRKETDMELAGWFPKELREDLIPAVEKEYLHGAVHYSLRGRKERQRRMFTGFSMGSVISWNIFCECLDLFSHFGMFSGDCWKKEWMGGSKSPVETVNLLEQSVGKSGYSKEQFFIQAYTGDKDIGYTGMKKQIEEMKKRRDLFDDENLFFHVMEKGLHNYDYGFLYFYHCLKQWKIRK